MTGSPDTVLLPAVDAPRASVVVLAWRLTGPLLTCLSSLVASRPTTAYELVLVLNGASDDVRQTVADGVCGARVVDSAVNLGFGVGANLGAHHARGEHILLLNDDTEVQPGWLDQLVAAADADPRIAMVSSTLLFPDGRLQQAGCRLMASADVMEFGQGLPELTPELARQRDVDFAGGAAALVRRSAFEQAGGFDPVFDPAYYEDVDLSLRLRALGWRVVYEPSAVAIHHVSSSTATDLHFRTFAVQRAGRIFSSRWESVLTTAPSRNDPVDLVVQVPPERPAASALGIRLPQDPTLRALRRQEEYTRWLTTRLDREISEVDRLEHALAAMAHARDAAEARLARAPGVPAADDHQPGAEPSAGGPGPARPLKQRVLRRLRTPKE